MKAILLLSVLLVSSLALNSVHNQLMKDVFNQWKLANNKFYKAGHEEQHRFNIFLKNFNTIAELSQQDTGAELGLNKFADLTSEEFESHYLGYHKRQRTAGDAKETISLQDLPTRVDWREKGAVTGVKNQGACGSCWAFSAIGALEGLHFNNKGALESFSEQNFVDCVTAGSAGCNGGWMTDAFDYSAKNGVETGKDYPYTARNQKCAFVADRAVRINSAYKNVTVKNVEAMKRAIVEVPVSVAIQANQAVFQFYVGGVIKALCGDKLNHGVLAVGYDTVSGHEAFIVKNSWGQNWGSKGYVFISTNGDANKGNGVCGILADAAYPTK